MDAEILFFMTDRDQSEFLSVAKEYCDFITENHNPKNQILHVGDYHLLFSPSLIEANTLFAGKLEIRLSHLSLDRETSDKERAKDLFRKLRNWIKKYYWSRLAYLNQNKKNKLTPSRNHWLGPDAKLWKEEGENNKLQLSSTSWMIFEIGY